MTPRIFLCFALPLVCVGSATGQTIPRPDHVLIVIEENKSYSQIIGNSQAPYINNLAAIGASFTQSFGVTHPSEPNYLALFSGSTQGVTDDGCTYTFTTPNFGRELLNASFTFTGYSEDMPGVGYTGCSFNQYWRKHNPWVNWQTDIAPSVNDLPVAVNQPFTSFPSDFSTLPTVAVVVPNQNNDMHDGTIAQGDGWLATHIDPYVQWAATHNSLLILTFDEDDSAHGNQITTIFVGPMVSAGQYAEVINHYNVLATLQDMFGVARIANTVGKSAITDCWIGNALPAPSNLTATAVSKSQINLAWADNSGDETGFKVFRSTDGATFTLIATLPANTTTYQNTGLQRNHTYYYRVRANRGTTDSADSNTASAKTLKK